MSEDIYYIQNDDLDRQVIYQNFGFLIPLPKGWDDDTTPSMYKKMYGMGKIFRHWGITQNYFPPPGKVVGLNEYKEGYAIADRYDLGEFKQQDGIRTKYGYKHELEETLERNHYYGVNNMVDLVPNQMFMANQRIVSAYLADSNGNRISDDNFLYPAYINVGDPKGVGGQGQHKYGYLKELDGWQVNGGNPHSVGLYSILSDGYLPYVWNKPGINVNVAYEGNIPSWFVDWDTKKVNSDGTYTVLATNGEIQYTYKPSILNGYHWGYDLHGGGQCTCTIEYMNGSYVPSWFLERVLFWGLNGWTYYSQTIPDIYGINNYLTVLCGFVQFVHFMPYAYWYEDPYEKAQTETFKQYIGDRGFQTYNSFQNNLGGAIGGMMSDWVSQQPGYNATTDNFGNFTIQKGLITSYSWWWCSKYLNIYQSYDKNVKTLDLKQIYPRGNDISCRGSTNGRLSDHASLESIFRIQTDPNGPNWNNMYGMFGENQEDVINSMIKQWVAYQGDNGIWTVEDNEKYEMYNRWWATRNKNQYTGDDGNSDVNQNILAGEYLLGTDMDNSNPLLQKDTVNWENFLFDVGFDSFRIDASMCVNNTILTQCAANMESRFGLENMRNGTNIAVNECYDTGPSPKFQKANKFPQLTMDSDQISNWNPLIGARGWPSQNLTDIVTVRSFSYDSRNNFKTYEAFPNWTLLTNHDQRKGQILNYLEPKDQDLFADADTWEMARYMGEKFYLDFGRTNKQMYWVNYITANAVHLSVSRTTPCMYFGDFWKEHKEYMSERTYYYGYLSMLLILRSRYCFGEYHLQPLMGKYSAVPGHDLFANVRMGINRSTGYAVVVGNNPYNEVQVNLSMGLQHANQKYKNMCVPFSNEIETDKNGILTIVTHGEMSPFVWGHLSIWVPAGE